MERDHLYVIRKHPCVWLSALCMLASGVAAILMQTAYFGWWIAAAAIFLLILLLSGDEMLYRTAVPVWMLCIVSAIGNNSALA